MTPAFHREFPGDFPLPLFNNHPLHNICRVFPFVSLEFFPVFSLRLIIRDTCYLSCLFVVCSPAFPVSFDICFACTHPPVPQCFLKRSLWVIYHLHSPYDPFRLPQVPSCDPVAFHGPYAFHHLPTTLSYKLAVRSLTFLVYSAMYSLCFSFNGTLTFYHGFPMDSLPLPSSNHVFFCVSGGFRALRSPYVTRYGAPGFHHGLPVGSPLSFPYIFRSHVSFP